MAIELKLNLPLLPMRHAASTIHDGCLDGFEFRTERQAAKGVTILSDALREKGGGDGKVEAVHAVAKNRGCSPT